jgi:hypothetical protein
MFKHFKNQDEFSFIWYLIKVRFFSVMGLFLLGFSEKSLEILQSVIQLKINKKEIFYEVVVNAQN